jgi:ribosome-associated heat shock protein Hsp15
MASTVRIDKFLWSVRLYKTRSKATEACRSGKVKVNEKNIRPAKTIQIGDAFQLKRGPIAYRYKIIELLSSRVGAKLVANYIENQTSKEELEKLEVLRLSYSQYRSKGLGRPTKKDRRTIDSLKLNPDDAFSWDDWDDWEDDLIEQ